MKKHHVEIKWQCLVFGIYFIISLMQTYSEHPKDGIYFSEFIDVVNVVLSECLLVNLLANWLMPNFLNSNKTAKFLLYLFLIYFGFVLLKYLTVFPESIDILRSYNGNQEKNSLTFFFFYSTINVVITYLVAYGLFSIKKSFRIEKRAIELEKEMNEAKLIILKNQINPHFLYNTLSYMYSQARPVSENLSKSILMLSDMMRYSLNKTDESGLVLIEKEIEYIENFIEIHRLRFENDFNLNFEVEGIMGNKKIVPLLLITFVENALKHGQINNANKPIQIKVIINNEFLQFSTWNEKQKGLKDITTGIGLENTKKRLEILYKNQHDLKILDNENTYEVKLKIFFI